MFLLSRPRARRPPPACSRATSCWRSTARSCATSSGTRCRPTSPWSRSSCAAGAWSVRSRVEKAAGVAARARARERGVRPGAHVRQPLPVLLHLPAAQGHAAQPVPEGRRLPPLVPLRELHDAHPLHRGRPRAGGHRGPRPAVREHPRDRPRGAHGAPAQPARRDEPALARRAARRRASRCTARSWCAPASTTATCSTTRCSASSTGSRASRPWASVPLGVSGFNREPDMRPHTRAEAEAVLDTSHAWQAALPRRARPPARVRGRRVLPDGRSSVPRARRVRGLRRSTRTASAWRASFEAEVHAALARRRRPRPTGTRSGFFAWVDGAPPEGYRAPRQTDGRARGARRAGRRGPAAGHRAHRRPTARACSRRSCRRSTERAGTGVRLHRGREPVLRRQHRGHRVCSPAPTSLRRSPTSLAGDRVLLPDVVLSHDRVPRRHVGRRPAPSGRGRRHRRRLTGGSVVTMTPRPPMPTRRDGRRGPVVARRRAAERRQVDAGEPHRRPPRRDRRGAAGRHARPQGAGRGVERAHLPHRRHRRLARERRSRSRSRSASRPSGR